MNFYNFPTVKEFFSFSGYVCTHITVTETYTHCHFFRILLEQIPYSILLFFSVYFPKIRILFLCNHSIVTVSSKFNINKVLNVNDSSYSSFVSCPSNAFIKHFLFLLSRKDFVLHLLVMIYSVIILQLFFVLHDVDIFEENKPVHF